MRFALPPRPTGTPPKEGNGLLKEVFLSILFFLFQEEDFEDGVEEIDDQEGDGEAEGVFAVEEHVQEQEQQAGKEFYGAGEHVGGDEFFAVLTVVAAEDDVHGEEGHRKEEEHE